MSQSGIPVSLPEDLDAERSLLATICAEGNHHAALDVCSVLGPSDFMHPAHRAVFEVAARIVDSEPEALSLLTLRAGLEEAGKLGNVGGFQGLVDLLACEEVGKPMTLVRILQGHKKRRELIRIGAQMIHKGQDVAEDPEAVVESTCSHLAALTQSSGDLGPQRAGEIAEDVLARMLDEANGRKPLGLKVGFPKLDLITRGFKPGQLIILAARPGIGKTSLALNWLVGASAHADGLLPFFGLEMGKEELTEKLLVEIAGVNPRKSSIKDPHVWDAMCEARGVLFSGPILIDDRSETTVRQIRAKVERLQAREKVSMVVVDYLQLLSSPKDSAAAKQNENARISEISRGLKLMAKDCGIPVVVLSQLNREVEKRSNGKPQLSDLRDSGAIEQDADMVVFIHRKIVPDLPQELQEKTGLVIVAKHRGGPIGCIPVNWDGELGRYSEQERETGTFVEPAYRGPGVQCVLENIG